MSLTLETILIITAITTTTIISIAVTRRSHRALHRRLDAQAAALRILAQPVQPPDPHKPPRRPHVRH